MPKVDKSGETPHGAALPTPPPVESRTTPITYSKGQYSNNFKPQNSRRESRELAVRTVSNFDSMNAKTRDILADNNNEVIEYLITNLLPGAGHQVVHY